MHVQLRLAMTVLCAGWACCPSSALAVPATDAASVPPMPDLPPGPHIRGLRSIPSNGALLIESNDGNIPAVTVTDASGHPVIGLVDLRSTLDTSQLWVWIAAEELELGTYQVVITREGIDEVAEPVSLLVVAPFPDELPPVMTAPSSSVVSMPTQQVCCTDPLSQELVASCFVIQEQITILAGTGLSSSATSAQLNQYLFRLVPVNRAAGTVDDTYRPLELVPDVSFYSTSADYCVELQAVNIATQISRAYAEPICAPLVDRQPGHFAVEVEDGLLANNRCLVPPSEYEQRWCTLNQHACDRAPSTECEIYDFVCHDGRVPRTWAAQTQMADDLVAVGQSDGCSVRAPAAAPKATRWALSALLLLLALRARRRVDQKPNVVL